MTFQYHYGIPPSPNPMQYGGMPYSPYGMPPFGMEMPNMIKGQRPMRLTNQAVAVSEAGGSDYHYNGVPDPNDEGFDRATIEDMPVLASLKRGSMERIDRMSAQLESQKVSKYLVSFGNFESNAWPVPFQNGKPYTLRKIDGDEPYPGVIIEEMLDSVSVHNGGGVNNNVGVNNDDVRKSTLAYLELDFVGFSRTRESLSRVLKQGKFNFQMSVIATEF